MDWIDDGLKKIREKGLFREMRRFEGAQLPRTKVDGRNVILLSSNSYLGLCGDERLKEAAKNAIDTFGVGSGGSRLTTGNTSLHAELESRIANFKETESALLFNCGYMANLGILSALADPSWVIFCDKLNHASIIDGCRMSGAKLAVYRHCDMADLEHKASRFAGMSGLIVTDGVFSMDGDIAPLPDVVRIAKKYNLMVMVDDAHATGVLGSGGRGTAEHFGINEEIDLQIGTLSKAVPSEGGFAAGKKNLLEYLRHKAKSFIYTTAMPPQSCAVSIAALEIIRNEPGLRKRLAGNSLLFRSRLVSMGFHVQPGETPIIPVMIGKAETAVEFSKVLLEAGVYVPAIRPPTVPEGKSRLRISLMAAHSTEDLETALEKLRDTGLKSGIIQG